MTVLNSTLRLSLLDQVSAPIRRVSAALGTFQRQQTAFMAPFRGLAGQVLAIGGAYIGVTAGLRSTAGAAMNFESAFADVRKVVEATDEQFENIQRTIRKMSTELPLTATDIAALFAAAGESGVATEDLKAFSEMAARVGIAFDMTAGQAGESLAKLKAQLGLTVAETGEMADAINHLSNNMASKASDITDYMLRVGKFAEMGGFAKEQVAAIGSAMISAGAQAETAGTAMMNVVRKMTIGSFAKKDQKEAAKALGLDLPTIAKQMKKDAPKALKTVLTAIGKAPEEQRIALLSKFFGDEARAFAPLVGNIKLLEDALAAVGDKTKFAGSAYNEYVARANTTANVLQLLRNKFAELGTSIGDRMLPRIKEAALGVGDILDTLGERGHIFAKMDAAMQGFMQGMGFDGGIREAINELGDLFFGEADGSAAADKIGRIFVKFKEWGEDVNAFSAAVANNPLTKFFTDLAPYGLQVFGWSLGIMAVAGAIKALAKAMWLLSGASAIVGILKTVGVLAGLVGGGGVKPPVVPSGGKPPVVPPAGGGWLSGLRTLGAGLLGLGVSQTLGIGSRGTPEQEADMARRLEAQAAANRSSNAANATIGQSTIAATIAQLAIDAANAARSMGIGGRTTDTLPGKTMDDVGVMRIDSGSIAAMIQPSGTQDVRVTNHQPPNVTVNNSIVINEAANPSAVASEVGAQTGQAVKSAVESSYSD